MFKGIVFDLDGTLVYSDVNFLKMKKRMITLLHEKRMIEGSINPTMTTVEIMRKAETLWKNNGVDPVVKTKLRLEIENIMNEVELEALDTLTEVPGAKKSIEELFHMGYRLAVLTRGHHEYAIKALEKTSMLTYFEIVFGRGETPRPKPYPEALQYTAQALSLRKSEILLIGDHHIDFNCAINAQVPFIGVRTGHRGEESWEDRRPSIMIDSVSDLPKFLHDRKEIKTMVFY